MPELYEIAYTSITTDVTLYGNNENVVVTSPLVKLPYHTHHINVWAFAQYEAGWSATHCNPRIRRGTTVTDPLISRDQHQYVSIPFHHVLRATVTIDPPPIAAGAAADVDVAVTGLTTNHVAHVIAPPDLEAGLVPITASVPAANTLRVRLYNPTAAAIDGLARNWGYLAYIPAPGVEFISLTAAEDISGVDSVQYVFTLQQENATANGIVFQALIAVQVM